MNAQQTVTASRNPLTLQLSLPELAESQVCHIHNGRKRPLKIEEDRRPKGRMNGLTPAAEIRIFKNKGTRDGCRVFLICAFRPISLTASLLRLRILRLAYVHNFATLAERVLTGIAAIDGLAGYNAVDFCKMTKRLDGKRAEMVPGGVATNL